MVQGYAFLLLLFHWLGLVCCPEYLSFNKVGKPKAHPKYLVVVLLSSLNLRPREVPVGSETLSQAVASIRPFIAPSINCMSFSEKRLVCGFLPFSLPLREGSMVPVVRGFPL